MLTNPHSAFQPDAAVIEASIFTTHPGACFLPLATSGKRDTLTWSGWTRAHVDSPGIKGTQFEPWKWAEKQESSKDPASSTPFSLSPPLTCLLAGGTPFRLPFKRWIMFCNEMQLPLHQGVVRVTQRCRCVLQRFPACPASSLAYPSAFTICPTCTHTHIYINTHNAHGLFKWAW